LAQRASHTRSGVGRRDLRMAYGASAGIEIAVFGPDQSKGRDEHQSQPYPHASVQYPIMLNIPLDNWSDE